MSNIGTEVRREVNAGIANMSRMIERLEVGENNRQEQGVGENNRQEQGHDSSSSNLAGRNSDAGVSNPNRVGTPGASAASN
ncbi:Zinc finger, RING/FYVE/PHD-type [Artemisia annua]|uniref:Zinc finger, RING/FYVE/PHD-type n=1 Tax=Artemisia annua TaxID=35608 RepID=A0A2U1KI53_ARTAN|nr:Zinc finger, RING/FYVE/PHD-type [Artemisia annua]